MKQKPTMKKATNQPMPCDRAGRRSAYWVNEIPTNPMPTMTAVCPMASRVLPAILPINSWRTGIFVVMISTIRLAFSSTTLPESV